MSFEKKVYNKPKAELICFDTVDVIANSGGSYFSDYTFNNDFSSLGAGCTTNSTFFYATYQGGPCVSD